MKDILTQQEFDFMMANKGVLKQTEIAKVIGKSTFTVSTYFNSKNPKPPKIKPLTQMEIEFIIDNKDKMQQNKIANFLHVTPACVNKVIQKHTQGKLVKMEGYFDIDDFAKQYSS